LGRRTYDMSTAPESAPPEHVAVPRAVRARRRREGEQLAALPLVVLALAVYGLRAIARRPSAGTIRRASGAVLAVIALALALRLSAPPLPKPQIVSGGAGPQDEQLVQGVVLAVEPAPAEPPAAGEGGAGGSNGVSGGGTGGPALAGLSSQAGAILTIRLTNGPQKGQVVHADFQAGGMPSLPAGANTYRPGDRVILSYAPSLAADQGQTDAGDGGRGAYVVVDHVRWPWLIWAGIVFAVAIIAVAGGQGARALVGLALAVCVMWWFMLPRLLAGQPPVAVGLVTCALIAIPSLLLTEGLGRRSLVPILGIGGSLVAVGIFSAVAVNAARLFGIAASEELSLVYVGTGGAVSPQGLLLAGVLLGAVGALVDVAVGQSAAVFEFHDADHGAARGVLFRRGMSVGRAHVTAAVYTLVLAYAGAALPLLMLFAMNSSILGDIWNREMIVAEALRSVAGSLGLAASVPLTTWLACLACRPLSDHAGDRMALN
jgi:uncharacterized membrane protein